MMRTGMAAVVKRQSSSSNVATRPSGTWLVHVHRKHLEHALAEGCSQQRLALGVKRPKSVHRHRRHQILEDACQLRVCDAHREPNEQDGAAACAAIPDPRNGRELPSTSASSRMFWRNQSTPSTHASPRPDAPAVVGASSKSRATTLSRSSMVYGTASRR